MYNVRLFIAIVAFWIILCRCIKCSFCAGHTTMHTNNWIVRNSVVRQLDHRRTRQHPTSVIRRDPSGSPSGAQKTLGSIRILDPDGFSSIRKNFRKKYILIRTAEGCISQPNYLINSDPGGKPLIRTEISSIRTKISGLPDD